MIFYHIIFMSEDTQNDPVVLCFITDYLTHQPCSSKAWKTLTSWLRPKLRLREEVSHPLDVDIMSPRFYFFFCLYSVKNTSDIFIRHLQPWLRCFCLVSLFFWFSSSEVGYTNLPGVKWRVKLASVLYQMLGKTDHLLTGGCYFKDAFWNEVWLLEHAQFCCEPVSSILPHCNREIPEPSRTWGLPEKQQEITATRGRMTATEAEQVCDGEGKKGNNIR